MATAEHPAAKVASFREQISSYNPTFWLANVMECMERWAYYGVRAVISLYIVAAVIQNGNGGLGFSHIQQGAIFSGWAMLQSLLPMVTGGFSDRYGYKKTIAVAITIKIAGYLLMASQHSFNGFFMGCLLLATGTAIFKPGVQGLIAHNTTKVNASLGWGLFYMLVNIGGFLGPITSGHLRDINWSYVFYANAGLVAVNYLTLLFLKEPALVRLPYQAVTPKAEVAVAGFMASAPAKFPAPLVTVMGALTTAWLKLTALFDKLPMPLFIKEPLAIFASSLWNVLEPRLISFLVIFAGFWLMFNQLFDYLPNFIDDWVNTSTLYGTLGHLFSNAGWLELAAKGVQVQPEYMINIDSGAIILLMVPLAVFASRFKPLMAIIAGIFISIVGIVVAGATMGGWLCALGILVFAVGEMLASPRLNDYIASLAPKEKKGLYLGYANVPNAIGWTIGSKLGGNLYETNADKVNFARDYMHQHLGMSVEAAKAIPKDKVMATLADRLHQSVPDVTTMLWNLNHPERIWYVFGSIGLASMIGMIIYHLVVSRVDARRELTRTVPSAETPVAH